MKRGSRGICGGLRILRGDGDGLAFELLWLDAAAIDDGQRHVVATADRRRQVDDQAVLPDHAQVKQPAEFRRVDASHRERFRQPQRHRGQRERADLHRDAGAPCDPQPVGREVDVDVVRLHVVIDEVILAVETSAGGEFFRRGVDGDVAALPAVEERDVFRVAPRSGVGEVAEPARAHLGNQIAGRRDHRPAITAQIGEIDLQRAADELLENLPGPAELGR